MNWSEIFDMSMAQRHSALYAPGDQGDLGLARASLMAFLAARGETLDTDIIDIAQPDWLPAYYQFVKDNYQSNKSRNLSSAPTAAERQRWANRYIKCIRKVVNRCIRYGYLPNIDYFHALPEFSRRQGIEEVSRVTAQLTQLARAKSAFRDGQLVVGAIDLYLLCMYCGGLELDEFFALAPEAIKSDPPRLHLPWAGIDIELSPTVYNALLQGRETAPRSPATVSRALEALNIDLYKSQSVFSDWLRFAKDIGISDQAILEMLELRRQPGSVASPQLAEAIRMVVKRMNQAYNKYKKQWYCLYVHRGWAKEKCEEILASDPPVLPGIAARAEDFYYPNTANVKMAKLKGQKLQDPGKVLRRYLFVHCYLSEIQTIAREVPRVSVLSRRESGLREYVAIPSHEVYTLKLMLDNLRGSEAELMLQDEDIVEAIDLSPLHEQERVRIVSPGYEDYEAVIAKVKPNSTYSVTFPNLGLSFTLQNVPRALIQRLPPP